MKKGVKKMSNHEEYKPVATIVWDGKKGTAKRITINGKKHYVSKT